MERIGRIVLVLVILYGLGFRWAFVAHPADARTMAPWRESDYTQVARAFYREELNPLYPRVDWRQGTTGEAEMEFPFMPLAAAAIYHLFGYAEEWLRVLSALCSTVAVWVVWRFSRSLLRDTDAALFSTAVFSGSAILLPMAGSIQPEPLVVLATTAAAWCTWRWVETDRLQFFYWACFLISLAILTKSPAAYLGLVMAYFCLKRWGWRALLRPAVYAGGALALLLPCLWYAWAHAHYLRTGLSLGVSNETHVINWALLADPWSALWGNIWVEARDCFAGIGLLLLIPALASPWRLIELPCVWYAAVALFYVVALDTSGDHWARYYHCHSVAPVALLLGAGYGRLLGGLSGSGTLLRSVPHGLRPGFAVAGLVAVLLLAAGGTVKFWRGTSNPELERFHLCCEEFKDLIPPGEQIVVRGGVKLDAHGHPVAYNASMAFTWLDRKGFNYAVEDYSVETLRQLAARGARYWVVQPADRRLPSVFEEAQREFSLVDNCGDYALYDLSSGPTRDGGGAGLETQGELQPPGGHPSISTQDEPP